MEEIMITHMTIDELKAMLRVEMQAVMASIPAVEGVPQEDLLTTHGACKLLGLTRNTIYALVHQREIPCMKRGNKLYFSKQELVRWVSQGRKSTKEELAAQAQAFLDNRPPRKKD